MKKVIRILGWDDVVIVVDDINSVHKEDRPNRFKLDACDIFSMLQNITPAPTYEAFIKLIVLERSTRNKADDVIKQFKESEGLIIEVKK